MTTSGILCIESLWGTETGSNRESVSPLVEYVSRSFGVRHTTFDCGTLDELRLRLKTSRRSGYRVLYFAGHGRDGLFQIDTGDVSLEELAVLMNGRFEGWSAHFGSCAVLNVKAKEIRAFKKETGLKRVSGYKKYVDWTMSSALDVAWLSYLVSGETFEYDAYGAMIRRLGFSSY